jgi:hypothetical protein
MTRALRVSTRRSPVATVTVMRSPTSTARTIASTCLAPPATAPARSTWSNASRGTWKPASFERVTRDASAHRATLPWLG